MAPIVHFVRHAQGYHNLSLANHVMPDPLLTSLGELQCRRLAAKFKRHDHIDLIVASPLRRTLHTALLAFEPAISARPPSSNNPLPFIALPGAQETADVPCDTGSDRETLEKEFEGKGIDFSLCEEGWNKKKGKYSPTNAALKARAKEVRLWLRDREEKEIVLVTHGGILHYITDDWTDYNSYNGTGWANTEHRTYVFPPTSLSDPNAPMQETAASKLARIGGLPRHDSSTSLNSLDSRASEKTDSSKIGRLLKFKGRDSPTGLRKACARDDAGYAVRSKV